jgi:serine/threonine protein kinase/uncharacterized RDD family membrane protein YckC
VANSIDLGVDYLDGMEMIGRGGFSTVYAADDVRFSRRVAVKVLAPLVDEADRRRFDRECQVMGRLSSHPNVVTVHDAGFSPDRRPYLIMELVDGGSLADLVDRDGPLPWQQAVDYAIPVCGALARAHREGILHRDIKPENILLGEGIPKVTDFGIAYLRDATGHSSTHVTASWLHAPPETFDNARDERSDLYSLASTLHTLITASAPFWRPTDDSLSPLIMRVLNEPPPRLAPELAPAELADLVERCLAKDPAVRPQSVAELEDALVEIRDRSLEPAPSDPAVPPTTPPSVATPPPGTVPPPGAISPPGTISSPGTVPPPGRAQPVEPSPSATGAPPGWYQAEGDEPNTQRYWDGTQWLGDPQPIAVAQHQNPPPSGADNQQGFVDDRARSVPFSPPPRAPLASPLPLASYGHRAMAFLIDVGILFIGAIAVGAATDAGDQVSIETGDAVAGFGMLILLALAAWNHGLRQGRSGRTLGKSALRIRLVSDATGAPPGAGKALVRFLITLALWTVTCGVMVVLNLLWPLWDGDRKRLLDRPLGLSVIKG